MIASHFDFLDAVVAQRDLVVTHADAHVCRLEPRESDVAWYCDLDDGTPTGDTDPASFVRWVCPRTREGLVVQSVSWWGSAPALDHQIGLALDIAHRLLTQR